MAEGHSPAVSPDGSYVLYVRTAADSLQLEDAWNADLDRTSEQQVTHNEPIDAWDGEMKEGAKQPYFTLQNLSWSNDGKEIALYQVTETNSTRRQLVRYMLSAHELAPEQVVGRAIEALIYRDERYAHSFFRYDPGYLKGTSPRQVGYMILNKSVDSKGKAVVTAAIDYS